MTIQDLESKLLANSKSQEESAAIQLACMVAEREDTAIGFDPATIALLIQLVSYLIPILQENCFKNKDVTALMDRAEQHRWMDVVFLKRMSLKHLRDTHGFFKGTTVYQELGGDQLSNNLLKVGANHDAEPMLGTLWQNYPPN